MDLEPLLPTCPCGADLLASSGNTRDTARCLDCTWVAGGTYAEHAGTHHHYETGHRWTLTVFQPLP